MPRSAARRYSEVPIAGPLTTNFAYRRQHLNDRFGGNRVSGISVSSSEPVALLFSTKEPSQQFYDDGLDDEGVYWYSGEGSTGDMRWTKANKAVRDHMADGRDLFLFERVQRKDGIWQFIGPMRYLEHRQEVRDDKLKNPRQAIVFGLIRDEEIGESFGTTAEDQQDTVESLRSQIDSLDLDGATATTNRIQTVYRRSRLIANYARLRAGGVCEACEATAPFVSTLGEPFLEVHHLDRLADGGADRPDKVAAICPNCHRRVHYGSDGSQVNGNLKTKIAQLESCSCSP